MRKPLSRAPHVLSTGCTVLIPLVWAQMKPPEPLQKCYRARLDLLARIRLFDGLVDAILPY